MSTIDDFNKIDDCDKINALCIDAYTDFKTSETSPTSICVHTPWGGGCIDLTDIVKSIETCTTLYLSPEENPNCLVYEPECGDNICINGNDLASIISLSKLKDIDQSTQIQNGETYIYNSTTGKFIPFDVVTPINSLTTALQNVNSSLASIQNRITQLEQKLTPPADAPDDVSVAFSNINLYSVPNVVIAEGSGTVTTLDKTHGIYGHRLSDNAYADEIMG